MIVAKINLQKLDKSHFFTGEKGTYLDVCLFETPDDKFGNDYVVVQSVSKEEREAGKRGPIVGNAKKIAGNAKALPPSHQHADNIPF